MTVCVAALSAYLDQSGIRHQAIVLAAERMITARRIREYELADQTKAIWHRGNLGILVSGSLDSLLLAYQNASLHLEKDCKVQDLAKALAEEMQTIRRGQVEGRYLQPYGLTLDSFVTRQQEMTPDFLERLDTQIMDEDNDLGEAIVAGFDGDDAHIFVIERPGYQRCFDATGFCAIGIGAEHAEAEFAHALYTPRRDWISAMRIAFFAKKRAEEAPGVGESTDLWHITGEGGYWYYEPQSKVVQELGLMYNTMRYVEITTIQTDAQRLNGILTEELNAATPRAATEEERRDAEARAEAADASATADALTTSGDSQEDAPPYT